MTDDGDASLNLSLSTNPSSTRPRAATRVTRGASRAMRATRGTSRRERRRSSNQRIQRERTETIVPPYPWATSKRATVHSLQLLEENGINRISGSVQCKRCDKKFDIEYDMYAKFREVAMYIMKNSEGMRDRAPAVWTNPTLPDCRFCGQHNCAKPVVDKKRNINWVFLFLGQMVGCCKLAELKYFCKHTENHRTGAKDRVLYLTYLEIYHQLDPQGSFHSRL